MRYSPFRHIGSVIVKNRPIQLTFFLTRKCNARCPFCFYRSSEGAGKREKGGPGENEHDRSELTLAETEKVSASLGSLLWLAFSGGEPFLREDLVGIARVFYKQNKPSIILLPTNGLLPDRIYDMTEAILKSCPKSTVVVKLSLDGPEETHDSLRGVPGAYQKVLKTSERLAALSGRYRNFELGVNTVFCSRNQHNMDELLTSVRQLDGVRVHTVSLIRGDVAEEQLKEVDPDAYAKVGERLARDLRCRAAGKYRFSGAGLKAAQDVLQRRLIHRTAVEKKRQTPCFAGSLGLVLTETGHCYPCEAFSNRMGNVRDFNCNVTNLLESREASAALQDVRRSGCYCTHECAMMMNILFNPRLYPALIAEYFRLTLPSIGKRNKRPLFTCPQYRQ
jgi:MoaA/NifB/PqqE/SkfB family radical SAM enzyme